LNKSKKNLIWKTLANSNFRKLWLGQLISQIGDGLAMMSMMLVASLVTNGSAIAVAGVTVSMALPILVIGLFAGVYVDRWDRKRIMVVSDLIRFALILTLVLVRDASLLWMFYLVAAIQSSVGIFFDPAKNAIMPTILEGDLLMTANALSQSTRLIANAVGMGLAAVIIGFSGSWLAFVIDAATFLVSAIMIIWMRFKHKPALTKQAARQKAVRQLGEGLHFIGTNKMLISVMFVYAVTMLGLGSVIVLVIPFLTEDLKLAPEWISLVEAFEGIGMVIGSGVVAAFSQKLKARYFMLGGTIGMGFFVALAMTAHQLMSTIYIVLGVGICLTAAQASASTLVQKMVPDEKRGRVLGALNVVYSTTSIVSMATAGILGDVLGIRNVFLLSGLVLVTAGLAGSYLIAGEKEPERVV
jgi:MFS family permease